MTNGFKYLKFGRFLLDKKRITATDVINARLLQKKTNLLIGQLAQTRGWLTEDQTEKVLIIQEDSYEKFGETAVKEGYLTEAQVEELLKTQEDSYLFFGEAMVQLEIFSTEQLIEELKEFNRMKIESASS